MANRTVLKVLRLRKAGNPSGESFLLLIALWPETIQPSRAAPRVREPKGSRGEGRKGARKSARRKRVLDGYGSWMFSMNCFQRINEHVVHERSVCKNECLLSLTLWLCFCLPLSLSRWLSPLCQAH